MYTHDLPYVIFMICEENWKTKLEITKKNKYNWKVWAVQFIPIVLTHWLGSHYKLKTSDQHFWLVCPLPFGCFYHLKSLEKSTSMYNSVQNQNTTVLNLRGLFQLSMTDNLNCLFCTALHSTMCAPSSQDLQGVL